MPLIFRVASLLLLLFVVCLVVVAWVALLLFLVGFACVGCGFFVGLWVVVLFPFGRYDKKKGRTVLARPLFVCGLLLFVC